MKSPATSSVEVADHSESFTPPPRRLATPSPPGAFAPLLLLMPLQADWATWVGGVFWPDTSPNFNGFPEKPPVMTWAAHGWSSLSTSSSAPSPQYAPPLCFNKTVPASSGERTASAAPSSSSRPRFSSNLETVSLLTCASSSRRAGEDPDCHAWESEPAWHASKLGQVGTTRGTERSCAGSLPREALTWREPGRASLAVRWF